MVEERWLPVPDCLDYEVSNQGRVRYHRGEALQVLGLYRAQKGDLAHIWQGGKWVNRPVHMLVASAFIHPLWARAIVRHINGDHHDNRVENLRVVPRVVRSDPKMLRPQDLPRPGEQWCLVLGFPEYEVSSLGRVRSARNGTGTIKGWVQKPRPDSGGYLSVALSRDDKVTRVRVHRLVYEAFIGPIPSGMGINHINSNKRDNRLENLEVLSPQDNSIHASRGGRMPSGPRHHLLSLEDVRSIRDMRAEGRTNEEIANLFGMSVRHISHVSNHPMRCERGLTPCSDS